MRGLGLHIDCLRELERDRQRLMRAHASASSAVIGLLLASFGIFASYMLELFGAWRGAP